MKTRLTTNSAKDNCTRGDECGMYTVFFSHQVLGFCKRNRDNEYIMNAASKNRGGMSNNKYVIHLPNGIAIAVPNNQ